MVWASWHVLTPKVCTFTSLEYPPPAALACGFPITWCCMGQPMPLPIGNCSRHSQTWKLAWVWKMCCLKWQFVVVICWLLLRVWEDDTTVSKPWPDPLFPLILVIMGILARCNALYIPVAMFACKAKNTPSGAFLNRSIGFGWSG